METSVYIAGPGDIEHIARALNSDVRRKIIKLLANGSMNIGQIAVALDLPQSTCTVNVQLLEHANIIKTEQVAATKGSQKICSLSCSEIVIPLLDMVRPTKDSGIEIEMPIGLYTDFNVTSPCGLVTDTGVIGFFDHASSFYDPRRSAASLIWFTSGFLEYRFPKNISEIDRILSVSIVCELCSEFPGYNTEWPSDITLWLNGVEVGTWTSPGDMGGKRGRFTPEWWSLRDSQYGFLKSWKVTRDGSFIDGVAVSDVSLASLEIAKNTSIVVRLGIKENAKNRGGMNIFGRGFGNYDQGIIMRIECEE
ncbi:MAG TPA: helix-turn-helix domain-containing protein [Spirochaetia bacterium]|nr:helix-turn-helix domain-containing protein [Spirochaetia bacterium]